MTDTPAQSIAKIQNLADLWEAVFTGDGGGAQVDLGDGGEPVDTVRTALEKASGNGSFMTTDTAQVLGAGAVKTMPAGIDGLPAAAAATAPVRKQEFDSAVGTLTAAVAAGGTNRTYGSTAAALEDGALPDGSYFQVVPSTHGGAEDVYLKVDGTTATYVATLADPSSIDAETDARIADVEALRASVKAMMTRGGRLSGSSIFAEGVDAARNRVWFFDKLGAHFRFAEAVFGGTRLTTTATLHRDLARGVDLAGNVVWRIARDGVFKIVVNDPEVVAARGSRAQLYDHLGESLTDFGSPRRFLTGIERCTTFRQKLAKLARGGGGQLRIGLLGTSWWSASGHACWRDFAATMVNKFGDGGMGYTSFSWPATGSRTVGNSNMRGTTIAYGGPAGGDWTTEYVAYANDVPSNNAPDLAGIASATAGDWVEVRAVGVPVLSAAKLLFTATADAVVKYSWDGGATFSGDQDAQGTVGALQALDLGNLPATGTFTLRTQVVSGAVRLSGIISSSAADGVTWNLIASSGSRANQYANASAADWKFGLSLLDLDFLVIGHNTNDRARSRTPQQYAADLTTIVSRYREVNPLGDVLLMAEWDTDQPLAPYDTLEYAAVMEQVASQTDAAFANFQYLPGSDTSTYFHGVAGSREWMVDAFHPSQEGKYAITGASAEIFSPALSLL